MTEAQKQKKWEIFAKFTENFEDKFKPILRKLFDDQEDEVLANLDKLKSVKAKIDIESILFDYDGAVAKFKRNGKPIMADVAAYSGNNELAQLNLPIAFDVENPRVVAFLKTAAMKFATEVNDTTIKALKATLSEGFAAGESIPDLAKRVQDVFDTASTSRATMIARTEVIEASNFGALESYKQSGVVEFKGWLSSRDDRVRDSHQIDGQEVGLDEDFILADGTPTQYPGESGDPGNDINERCTIYAVTKSD